ncbi:MAG TPA: SLC13 family permease [Gammaproteobacteria bacterium]|nr:SLC13 family permease [Gammaproteobacteria bacterium]
MPTQAFTGPMLVSGIVLALTFVAIFTEQLHRVERAKVACVGAIAMIVAGQIFGFYGPGEALEAIDWNVVLLLAAMMAVVIVMVPTGGFEWLAYKLAAFSRGNRYLTLLTTGTAVTLLSLLLDNVTTVVIFGPLLILIAEKQRVSPVPYLLAAAVLSNTGGVGTLVGDPPNIMIGSAAEIDFNTFFLRMAPIAFVAWLAILLALKVVFRKELAGGPVETTHEPVAIRDRRTWTISLLVLLLMLVLFTLHRTLGWEAWFVAVLGMTVLLLAAPHAALDTVLARVEVPLLVFFIGLFMLVGGVQHSGLLSYIGQFITPFVQRDLLTAAIVLMWVAAVLSAAIDNIPFTAAMIPIISSLEMRGVNVAPLWWALSMGVGLGGNGTHIGASANVFVVTISERLARERGDPSLAITPGAWFRKGTPATLASLIVASIVFVLFFDYFARPVH